MQPDVLFLIFESFSPLPRYVDPDVIESSDGIIRHSPYNSLYLPNLNALASKGFTALGVASAGLPTIFGWHSLMTTEKPLLNGINMVSSVENEDESFIN